MKRSHVTFRPRVLKSMKDRRNFGFVISRKHPLPLRVGRLTMRLRRWDTGAQSDRNNTQNSHAPKLARCTARRIGKMRHALRAERLSPQRQELHRRRSGHSPEIADHMGLIEVTARDSDLGPVASLIQLRQRLIEPQ
jgi:hypothetical protein